MKKLEPGQAALPRLMEHWRDEAAKAGRMITRIVLATRPGGMDFGWRGGGARGIEAYVIHPASVAASRKRKRAKTDRRDTAMLLLVFLGRLRGARGRCGPSAALRPSRAFDALRSGGGYPGARRRRR